VVRRRLGGEHNGIMFELLGGVSGTTNGRGEKRRRVHAKNECRVEGKKSTLVKREVVEPWKGRQLKNASILRQHHREMKGGGPTRL